VKWHVHPADPAADYQTTFNAETQLPGYGLHGYRPAYVALSADQTYCSVFKDDVVGPWVARHGMTSAEYQTFFNQQTAAGDYPICVQGGGTTANAVYAAIFARQDIPSARQWTATGAAVPALAAFDNAFQQFMQTNAVRAAQFTLSRNGSVLLARAYTWAEPGYRLTQPSDRFLLASCSKMFCEQAIQTLYNSGALSPPKLVVKPNGSEVPVVGDTITGNSSGATANVNVVSGATLILSSVKGTFTNKDTAATMSLSGGTVAVVNYTPSTAAYPLLGFSHPADARSDTITVQQLLDHEGGYNDGTNSSLPSAPDPTYNMRAIALALGLKKAVQKLDIANYMYGQTLQYTPGTNSAYSNYGYLLLSAFVEKVTGMPYFQYVQEMVLAPLGITEVLLSSTEAQLRDPSEAICEDQGLGLDPINISSNLLTPAVYGGDGQIKEVAAGCAGLAASATALTQFIHVNLVWGNGPRPPNTGNWWLGRTGSTPGTSTEAASLSGGIDWAYVINTRDFPPQTSLPLPSLATTIGNLIDSTPGL
jgi:CubicO group peptidase (beta-lactamase class C family)